MLVNLERMLKMLASGIVALDLVEDPELFEDDPRDSKAADAILVVTEPDARIGPPVTVL